MKNFGLFYFGLMQIIGFIILLSSYISDKDYFLLFWIVGFGHFSSFLLFVWAFYKKRKDIIFYIFFLFLSSLSFSYINIGFTSITGFLFGIEYNLQRNVIVFYFDIWRDEYVLNASEDFIRLNFVPFIIFYVFMKKQIFYTYTNKKAKIIKNKSDI